MNTVSKSAKSSRRYWLVAALVVALVLRLGAAIGWEQHVCAKKFAFPDSYSYWYLAGQIARGQPYQFGGRDARVFRAPLYPLVLAVFFRARGGNEPPVLWPRLGGAVLGLFAVGGVSWLAIRLFSPRAGVIGAWLAACYPGAIGMSIFILSEAVFVPLMIAQLAFWVAAWQSRTSTATVLWSLSAGLCGGLATLARPSWLLFVPFALVVALVWSRHRRRQLATGALVLAATAATMSPWWVRNYYAVGTWVPTTLQLGASLYDGFNPRATGGSDMWFSKSFHDALVAEDEAAGSGPPRENFEVRLNRRLRAAALAWVREHPAAAVRLAWHKLLRTWSPWPRAAEFQSWPARLVVVIGYLPLALLALVGAVRYVPRGWSYGLCILPAVYTAALHVVFVGSLRYRQPAMLAATVLAAGLLADLSTRKRA